jgi:lipopolysaccharide export system permease protein|tara:strand:+ start:397 stop:1539 length:1143 start_codon:yes stop_codon:yes gene_type:complete
MLKNKIYRYFLIEIAKSFLTILFAFTAIAWTVRAVNFLDLIVDSGHALETYAIYSMLNIPGIITRFIPLSFLLALILSIIKFERQNELLILWTTGLKKISLANLFFKISFLILLIQLLFAVYITPYALNKSRTLIRTSNFDSLSAVIKERSFTDSFEAITFFVDKKDGNNTMENIFIRDNGNVLNNIIPKDDNETNTTIFAKKGIINNKKLILFDGIIQNLSKSSDLENIYFKKTEIIIDTLRPRTIKDPKLQETTTLTLINCALKFRNNDNKFYNCPILRGSSKNIIEVIARRIGMPIYIPLISLICCFMLSAVKKKKFKTLNKYIYFLISFFILIFAEILVRYSGFSDLNTSMYFLTPLILIPTIYLLLIKKLTFYKN